MVSGPEVRASLEKDAQKSATSSRPNTKLIHIIQGKKRSFGLRIITTKKIGNAVKRNGVRRRIKESFRLLGININNDITIIPKAGIIKAAFGDIKQNIKDLLRIAN